MTTIATRFGEVEFDPKNTVEFPCGLVGFESLRHFIVMPNSEKGPLFWIQSTEDAETAFILSDPTGFFLDYGIRPETEELEKLGVDSDAEVIVLSIVTVHSDRTLTFNLLAPVLFSPSTNRAIQVIL